jgi:hypothetical protein
MNLPFHRYTFDGSCSTRSVPVEDDEFLDIIHLGSGLSERSCAAHQVSPLEDVHAAQLSSRPNDFGLSALAHTLNKPSVA